MKLPYLGLAKESSLTGCTALSLLHIINIMMGSLASIYNREGAPLSLNKHQVAYEGFLEGPVLGVIVAMWLAGVTLMGLGVASLYLLWVLLRMLITGV